MLQFCVQHRSWDEKGHGWVGQLDIQPRHPLSHQQWQLPHEKHQPLSFLSKSGKSCIITPSRFKWTRAIFVMQLITCPPSEDKRGKNMYPWIKEKEHAGGDSSDNVPQFSQASTAVPALGPAGQPRGDQQLLSPPGSPRARQFRARHSGTAVSSGNTKSCWRGVGQ